MSGQLGCAEEYTAMLHWRGGARPYAPVQYTSAVSWSRTLRDISDAQITIPKGSNSPACCEAVGAAEPWIHELTLYRDAELIWQGPILRTVERRDSFTIEAVDVLGWLERVINTWRVRYVAASGSDGPGVPPANGRYRRPITQIAENIIRLNLVESSLSVPPDWCQIMEYIVRRDPAQVSRLEKDGSSNTAIWTESVYNILGELTKKGLSFTTVGRSIVLTGPTTLADPAVARMALDHILGDPEVIRDGTSAATLAFATNQNNQNISEGDTVIVGETGTEYGRLDVLETVQSDTESPAAEQLEELEEAARATLAGRYPAPIALNVPESARLAPTAPVQVNELVCGSRLDVAATDYCTQIGQPFVLSDVAGTWSDSSEGGEQIGISLVPLADPYGQPIPDPDEEGA